ncbi:hypothetical protein MAPG_03727 [Magnaporthiopsis poae ATCC 64411]|uniref:Uncharacterized protein n=1 Tax=Magnaporthiopsis poae (strain ATCC 64411 / 73-15) TaxID=644358 RepID=A0A0C4DUT4_MAGP6|nr:hypothetical protein MAPG_03727 [Magnaporthiopsis poae ATCC 64411]
MDGTGLRDGTKSSWAPCPPSRPILARRLQANLLVFDRRRIQNRIHFIRQAGPRACVMWHHMKSRWPRTKARVFLVLITTLLLIDTNATERFLFHCQSEAVQPTEPLSPHHRRRVLPSEIPCSALLRPSLQCTKLHCPNLLLPPQPLIESPFIEGLLFVPVPWEPPSSAVHGTTLRAARGPFCLFELVVSRPRIPSRQMGLGCCPTFHWNDSSWHALHYTDCTTRLVEKKMVYKTKTISEEGKAAEIKNQKKKT